MAFWYVCEQDQLYGGFHGIKYESIEVGTEDDASDTARELSIDIITSYPSIHDTLEQNIADECDYYNIDYWNDHTWSEDDCDKIEEIRDMIYEEDIDAFYIELNETKLPTTDPYELDKILHDIGTEEFLKKL